MGNIRSRKTWSLGFPIGRAIENGDLSKNNVALHRREGTVVWDTVNFPDPLKTEWRNQNKPGLWG